MGFLLNIFTTDCQRHTAKMAVVETLWQLHTVIAINSWSDKCRSYLLVLSWSLAILPKNLNFDPNSDLSEHNYNYN